MEAGFPIFVAEDTASIVEDTAKDGNGGLLGYLVCRVDGDVVWAESYSFKRVPEGRDRFKLYGRQKNSQGSWEKAPFTTGCIPITIR